MFKKFTNLSNKIKTNLKKLKIILIKIPFLLIILINVFNSKYSLENHKYSKSITNTIHKKSKITSIQKNPIIKKHSFFLQTIIGSSIFL